MIQTKKGVIKFTSGKYKTEDKAEIALLKNFPDVEYTVSKAIEKEKEPLKETEGTEETEIKK